MKLNSIYLKNYRCFDQVQLDLHSNLTVIVAENGVGKSTILDAIRVGLWPFISSFDLARSSSFNDPSNSIPIDDAKLIKSVEGGMARQLPVTIKLNGDWGDGEDKDWARTRESEATRSKTIGDVNCKKLISWASQVQAEIRDVHKPVRNLPVFGYYGTGRLWAQKNLMGVNNREKDDTSDTSFYIRTFGYQNCMDSASSYKHFRQWFIWAWQSRSNMNERRSVSEKEKELANHRIEVVQKVIDTFLKDTTGWHTLEFSVEDQQSLILNHDVYGWMKVDNLSDGIRSVLAMIGDIAHRCVKLNPHLGISVTDEAEGVVLIDEVDMHLHPRWQQLVLTQLIAAFPKIQFVVTTHSPQVLTTVKPESIRGLKAVDDKIIVKDDYEYSEGAESQSVLEDILGVKPRPSELPIVKDLNAYIALVRSDQWDSSDAKKLREKLDIWASDHEPELLKLDMDIRLREFRRKKTVE